MELIENLVLKIKRRETPAFDMIYRVAKSLNRTHIPDTPVLRAVARGLYVGRTVKINMKEQLVAMLWAEPMFRAHCVRVGKDLKVEVLPDINGHTKIYVGDNVTLSGPIGIFSGRFKENPELIIGNNVYIAGGTRFTVNERVELKDHCSIAGGCFIVDSDGHPLDWERRAANAPLNDDEIKPVTLGEYVWVGRGATIMKGVTVGDRSVVGAGSVVLNDVPPDSLAMGSPARVLKLQK